MNQPQMSSTDRNKLEIINKIDQLDYMLKSLGSVHQENEKQMDEIHKKISTKKLILMEEFLLLVTKLKTM